MERRISGAGPGELLSQSPYLRQVVLPLKSEGSVFRLQFVQLCLKPRHSLRRREKRKRRNSDDVVGGTKFEEQGEKKGGERRR